MAIPFLVSLKSSLQGELWGIGKNNGIHIYNGHDLFDRYISFDSKDPVYFLDVATKIKRLGFVRGIALPHSFRAALLFYLAGIDERVGYARNKRGFMLNHKVPESLELEPTLEHYLRIMDSLGGKRIPDEPVVHVTTDEAQKFDSAFNNVHKPYVMFVIGAQYGPSKCWPPGHFARLADLVSERLNLRIHIAPGRGEDAIAGRIRREALHKDSIEIESMGVRDLKVRLSRAEAVVSNDTGPRHISSALCVPTVVLLGPMDERYTSYKSAHTHVMSADVPCRPCNKKRCDGNHECLSEISPDMVFSKLESIIGT